MVYPKVLLCYSRDAGHLSRSPLPGTCACVAGSRNLLTLNPKPYSRDAGHLSRSPLPGTCAWVAGSRRHWTAACRRSQSAVLASRCR